jgi:hypothetical protein
VKKQGDCWKNAIGKLSAFESPALTYFWKKFSWRLREIFSHKQLWLNGLRRNLDLKWLENLLLLIDRYLAIFLFTSTKPQE